MSTLMEPVPRERLARRAARAIAWSYVSWFSAKLLVLAATAILARLLTPEDFGVVGFATVAIAYLTVIKDLGFGAALVQRRTDVEEASDTVFTLNLLTGSALALATIAAAPAVADWFGEPRVVPMLRVLSFGFVLDSLGSTHTTLLQRSLSFRRRFIPDVGAAFIRGAVAVAAALTGLGPWALIAGYLAGNSAGAGLAWVVHRWRPRLRISRRLVRPLLGFGLPLLGANAVHALVANLDYVIVGKVLGGTALGVYTLAYRLPELLLLGVVSVLNRAVFPAMAEVQHRKDSLRRGFLATMQYVPMVVAPIGIGLALAADPIVKVTLGDQWLDAIPVMRVLAIYALASSLMVADGDVYKAVGRPNILARFAIAKLALLVPALLIGVRHGLVAVALAHLTTTVAVKAARALAASRILEIPLLETLRPMVPTAAASVGLTAAAGSALLASQGLADLTRLIATVAAGAAAYLLVLVRMEGDALRRLVRLIGKQKTMKQGR